MQIDDLTTAVFIGHDVNINLPASFTGAELQDLLDRLLPVLRSRGATAAAGVFQGGEQKIVLGAAEGDALHQYLQKRRARSGQEAVEQYLVRLCLDPDYQRWQRQYVVLSGAYQTGPADFARNYFARYAEGEGLERKIRKEPLPDVRAALTTRDPRFQTPGKLILLAQPGAGKTTVLRRLVSDQALARLQDPGAHFPFYASLAQQREHEDPYAFLERVWREQVPEADAGYLDDLRLNRRLCLLLDGVNEMRTERMDARLDEWKLFARELLAGNQLVFACRTDEYHRVPLGVQQVEIDPLTPEQILDFARRAYDDEEKAAGFYAQLQGPHRDLLWMAQTPFYLQLLVEEYVESPEGTLPSHRALLLVNVIARLFAREQERQPREEWLPAEAQRDALAELAFAMQKKGEGTVAGPSLWQRAIPDEVTVDHRTIATPPRQVVTLARRAGLLRWLPGQDDPAAAPAEGAADEQSADTAAADEDQLRFEHQLFQEYFAAEAMCVRFLRARRRCPLPELDALWQVPFLAADVPDLPRGEWDPLPPAPAAAPWEQTTILAAGLQPGLVACVRRVNPALAARCLLELPGGRERAAAAECRQDLLARLGDAQVHLRSRIEAGLLLGRLGDPRFPHEERNGVRFIRPPLVEIDPTGAVIGSLPGAPDAEDDEMPRHSVALAPYAIGRYPVTRGEYACFVAAVGYDDEQYWTGGGKYWRRGESVPGDPDPVDWYMDTWRRRKQNPDEIERLLRDGYITAATARNWRDFIAWEESSFEEAVRRSYYPGKPFVQPNLWEDDDFNNAGQPVVGVTWYEAAAYANWLAAVTGEPYRLLSEPEWEWAAARGERIYPWGPDWNPAHLNSIESKVLRTTPVGAYPQGATPDGIYDLAGNVWEWTATIYASTAYQEDARQSRNREDLDGTGYRVVRGGGWTAKREWVRCAYRGWYNPWDGSNTQGFRLARTLS